MPFFRAVTGGTGNWGWVSAWAVTGGTGVNGLIPISLFFSLNSSRLVDIAIGCIFKQKN